MTRYFFDLEENGVLARDEIGVEVGDPQAVRRAAIMALAEFARDIMPEGDDQNLTMKVRDETGIYVFEATLSLSANWIGSNPPR